LSRVERLLQKELSEMFREETQWMRGRLVSVSVVRVSADLSVAKAYLSIYPSSECAERLSAIRSHAGAIRYALGKRVGRQLRKIPELSFFADDSLDYIERIDKLLRR